MRRRSFIRWLAFAAALAGIFSSRLQAEAPADPAPVAQHLPMLDEFLTRAEGHGFSGAVLVAKGDSVLLRKGYGFADRRRGTPVRPDTVFAIASLDKQFIAAAILRLEESGKLKTSDPLSRFFDFVPPDKAAITLHQVLLHTSGLRNEYWDEHPKMSRAEFVHFILCDQKLEAPPGRRWNYSNSGFWLLEEVIARASGKPYEQFIEEALFAPAGMGHTGLPSHPWQSSQVARYEFWTGASPHEDYLHQPRYFWQILSTVDDLYRWYRALRDDRVLSAASKKKLFTPVKENYAYGWNVVPTERGTVLRHHGGSGTRLGMLATFRWFVEEDVFLCVLSNSMNPSLSADYFCGDIEHILFGGKPALPPAGSAEPRPEAGLEGDYELPDGVKVSVSRTSAGPLALETSDPRAIMLLRFPGAAAPAERIPVDAQTTTILRGIDSGDFEPLRVALGKPKSFDRFKVSVQGLVRQWHARFGGLRDLGTIYQRSFEFEGTPELQSFVRMRYERGDAVVRIIHSASGEYELSPVRMPGRLEVLLAPCLSGGYSTWDFTLGTGTKVTFEAGGRGAPARIKIGGGHGQVVGARRGS